MVPRDCKKERHVSCLCQINTKCDVSVTAKEIHCLEQKRAACILDISSSPSPIFYCVAGGNDNSLQGALSQTNCPCHSSCNIHGFPRARLKLSRFPLLQTSQNAGWYNISVAWNWAVSLQYSIIRADLVWYPAAHWLKLEIFSQRGKVASTLAPEGQVWDIFSNLILNYLKIDRCICVT